MRYIWFLHPNSSSNVILSRNNVHWFRYNQEIWVSFNNHFPHPVPILYQNHDVCFNGKLWDPLLKGSIHVKSKYCHSTCPLVHIMILSFPIFICRWRLQCRQASVEIDVQIEQYKTELNWTEFPGVLFHDGPRNRWRIWPQPRFVTLTHHGWVEYDPNSPLFCNVVC